MLQEIDKDDNQDKEVVDRLQKTIIENIKQFKENLICLNSMYRFGNKYIEYSISYLQETEHYWNKYLNET